MWLVVPWTALRPILGNYIIVAVVSAVSHRNEINSRQLPSIPQQHNQRRRRAKSDPLVVDSRSIAGDWVRAQMIEGDSIYTVQKCLSRGIMAIGSLIQ